MQRGETRPGSRKDASKDALTNLRGEISPETDVATVSAFLTSQLAGLAVLAKAGTSADELSAIAEAALATIHN